LTTGATAVIIGITTRTTDDDHRTAVQAATIDMKDNTLSDTRKVRNVIESKGITAEARNIVDTEAPD
jgi:hypothetical protein